LEKLKVLRRGPIPAFKSDEIEILYFLWRWKFATTMLLRRVTLQNKSRDVVYKKLLKLEKSGYIDCVHDPEKSFIAWVLTTKGCKILYEARPKIKEGSVQEGFASENPRHDFLVTAFHIGDWSISTPKGVTLVSEQEMRRLHEDALPAWLPPTGIHRPDGYTLIENDSSKMLVAIEVELSQKNEEAYNKIFRFYSDRSDIKEVIWMVENESTMQRLKRVMACRRILEPQKHLFILLEDFLASQWEARFIGFENGITLREYYWQNIGKILNKMPSECWQLSGYVTLLKPAKYPSS